MVGMNLTPTEDADLRRLAVLYELGFLRPDLTQRFVDLRKRDRRNAVRPVAGLLVRRIPLAKKGDGSTRVGRPCSAYPIS